MLAAGPSAPSLVLWDTQPFPDPPGGPASVTALSGDLMDEELVARAFADGVDAVVHLAAVVSAQAEADFDLGMRVNVAMPPACCWSGRAGSAPARPSS